MEKAAAVQAIQYNKNTKKIDYKIGDLVYMDCPQTEVDVSKKFQKKYRGPFRIIAEITPVTFKIRELHDKFKEYTVHANRVKHFYDMPSFATQEMYKNISDKNTTTETPTPSVESKNYPTPHATLLEDEITTIPQNVPGAVFPAIVPQGEAQQEPVEMNVPHVPEVEPNNLEEPVPNIIQPAPNQQNNPIHPYNLRSTGPAMDLPWVLPRAI
jgi:hypothetical protein